MKSKIALVVVTLVALIVAGAALVYAQPRLMAADRDPHSLVGSLTISVIPAPGAPIPPFVNYVAYTKDGLTICSRENGQAGVGTWIRTGGNQFAATFTGIDVSDGQTIQYKVRTAVELGQDGETWTAPFITEISDLDGNPLFTITGTSQGTRMHTETLD